jgi:biofilm protein TabA
MFMAKERLFAAVLVLMACGALSGCRHTSTGVKASTMKAPIIDRLENCQKYAGLHPDFERAFAFLRRGDLAQLELTKHVIDGDRVYCMLSRNQGGTREQASLEAHRKYIDIQYVISGDEEMGYKPAVQCRQVKEAYNSEKDFALFMDPPNRWLAVPPGSFIIFFPQDAHAPLVGSGLIHKAVVKVMVAGPNP